MKYRSHVLTRPVLVCVFVFHSPYPPYVVGLMNAHIHGYQLGRFPAESIQWVGDGNDEADVRDCKAGAVNHRVSLRNRTCSCCRPAEEDIVCEHVVATQLFAGKNPFELVPERYTVAERRQPYDAIASTGGFPDVTDAECRALKTARRRAWQRARRWARRRDLSTIVRLFTFLALRNLRALLIYLTHFTYFTNFAFYIGATPQQR